MNRTYEDFQKYIKENGLEGQFSKHDLALAEIEPEAGFGIAAAKLGYAKANTAEEKAAYNAAAERIRNYSGYSGGSDGSGFLPVEKQEDTAHQREAETRRKNRELAAGDVAQKAEAWKQAESRVQSSSAAYDQRRDRLLSAAENLSFSYEPEKDPVWQSYVRQYSRAGQRAGEDALGKAAAVTGGVPSSYAVTAAAQAEGEYASRLSEELPELYRDAYDRYTEELDSTLKLADSYNDAGKRAYETASKERSLAQSAYESALEAYTRQVQEDADWESDYAQAQELDYYDWLERFLAAAAV